MPKRTDIKKILIIGSGPIIIGQACEFDYSGTQACKALRAEGYEVVLINSNPATIMTDPEFGDRTYIEPITPEFVEAVIREERPDELLPTVGGQTALNCTEALWHGGVLERYGGMKHRNLLRHVYERYPWFASRSQLTDLRQETAPNLVTEARAIYTVGYEGRSVDSFFNGLLRAGVLQILDVRANPMSRKYGFARRSMSEISAKLGIGYKHMPSLGIPREFRKELSDFDSYQRLLDRYESEMLPERRREIEQVSSEVQDTPSAFLCMEKDTQCCHRSRLAKAVSLSNGLPIVHL